MDDYDIASYADDTTPFVVSASFEEVKTKLESISLKFFEWLSNNQMKGNAEKCHLILNKPCHDKFVVIEDAKIFNSKEEKLLGVTFDNNLHFETHINSLCKTGENKISALARLSPFMSQNKRRLIMNAFFSSLFNYCPLIWLFHSRTLNNKINRLHERCLRIIYDDTESSFDQLLTKDKSVCHHHRSLQLLAVELYKVVKNISPLFLNEIFIRNEKKINTRSDSFF